MKIRKKHFRKSKSSSTSCKHSYGNSKFFHSWQHIFRLHQCSPINPPTIRPDIVPRNPDKGLTVGGATECATNPPSPAPMEAITSTVDNKLSHVSDGHDFRGTHCPPTASQQALPISSSQPSRSSFSLSISASNSAIVRLIGSRSNRSSINAPAEASRNIPSSRAEILPNSLRTS